jgi:hypothetical protein
MVRVGQIVLAAPTIANGNESNKNRDIAGKTISLVSGSVRTYAAAAKLPSDTSNGTVPQNIMPNDYKKE